MITSNEMCSCNVCSGQIGFTNDQAGQTVTCPHCGMDTLLYLRARPPVPAAAAAANYPDHFSYCPKCGTVAEAKTATPGDILTEIVLWCLLLLPGLLYSAWRLMNRARVCAACESRDIIPVSTPRAQEALIKR